MSFIQSPWRVEASASSRFFSAEVHRPERGARQLLCFQVRGRSSAALRAFPTLKAKALRLPSSLQTHVARPRRVLQDKFLSTAKSAQHCKGHTGSRRPSSQ
jgi:hypothetical protein